jgi:RNA polymerase sigma-70 factor (ECF subfamily)
MAPAHMLTETDLRSVRPYLLRGARRLGLCADDRDDLVQCTLIRMWAYRQSFDGRTVRRWAYTVMLNIWRDELRARRRRPAPLTDVRWETVSSPIPNPTAQRIRDCVDGLSPRLRAVAVLRLDGYTEAETAARLQVPVGTVKSRYYKARAVLRERLSAL